MCEHLHDLPFSDADLSPSKTMESLSLAMKYDEHFRHVLALLDTTVERGTYLNFCINLITILLVYKTRVVKLSVETGKHFRILCLLNAETKPCPKDL